MNYVKKPSCRYVNQDTKVLNGLFDDGKYVAYDVNTRRLAFYDVTYSNVIEFTTIMPETRDIMPITNFM